MRKFFQENFYVLTAAMLCSVFISNDAFLPAIPSMAVSFASSAARLQQGVALFVLGSLFLQIFIGPLSDRYGRRPIMLGGAVIFLLGTLGCISAQNIYVFLFSRIFQGMAMATTQVTAMAAINEYYQRDKAVSALSLSININLLAPILGPIFGAAVLTLPTLLATEPWRHIFIYIFILGLCATVMLAFFMPEPSRATKTSLLYIFSQVPKILKNRIILLYCISLFMSGFGLLLWITGAPIMMMKHLGLSENAYAWVQAPVFLCTILGNSVAPMISRRIGALRHMNITHSLAICNSPLIFLLPFLWRDSATALVLAFSLFSLSLGLINAVKNQMLISLSEYKGSITSVLMLFGSGGVFLGSLSASFLGHFANYYSFLAIAVASFAMGALVLIANSLIRAGNFKLT